MNLERLTSSPILVVILACEIGFWFLLLIGLSVRYLLRQPRASTAVLMLVPLVDLGLLVAVAVDLHNGADVGSAHRIAGIYLGVTVAFGHSVIRWADVRFAHAFADGPPPVKPPKGGRAGLRYEAVIFGRWLLAAAVAVVVIFALSHTVADARQAAELGGIYRMVGIITVIWFVTGPMWASFSAADDPDDPDDNGPTGDGRRGVSRRASRPAIRGPWR